jgi:dolichol-phosphate mannosyltransferase
MDGKRILAIVPTYQERSNIGALIQRLNTLQLNLDILVIDDNSPDGTSGEVENLSQHNNNITLIVRDKKRGFGSAYKEGFAYALENHYDYIVQMDADAFS